ncbi:MAG: glycosyltransferase involved in cell wall biosynthesis [Bacteroidia bacterium]|jgi:glycosyltransferase involved in cell wall biosynthesis
MAFSNTSMIILSLLGVATLIQLGYYLGVFLRLVRYQPQDNLDSKTPVSVIICARNEADNLKENLPLILDQQYSEFEVVVVNDHSVDETEGLMIDWRAAYPNLKFVNLTDDNTFMEGKKFAVTMGIKGATHERLIFTDADCKPTSKRWLELMSAQFSTSKKIVLGYGAYEKLPGFLNKMIRFDTFFIALQYMSYALAGIPYMGVGRNMAYTKDLFFKTKGFIKHRNISSGDDDLMVNEVATGKNTAIQPHSDSHTVSAPKKSWSTWFTQKRRHLTTGAHYRFTTKLQLGLFMMSQILFFTLVFIGLFVSPIRWYVLGIYGMISVFKLFCFRPVMRLLGEEDLLVLSPVLEPFILIFNLLLYVSNKIKAPIKWK